jgi:hypothetical protein
MKRLALISFAALMVGSAGCATTQYGDRARYAGTKCENGKRALYAGMKCKPPTSEGESEETAEGEG